MNDMGFRFRKSIKIAPGVRVNIGKKSTSISFGGKGARYTVSSTGRKTASVGIPGTGLSYVATETKKKPSSKPVTVQKKTPSKMTYKVCSIIMLILGILTGLMGLMMVFALPPIGIAFILFAAFLGLALRPLLVRNNRRMVAKLESTKLL